MNWITDRRPAVKVTEHKVGVAATWGALWGVYWVSQTKGDQRHRNLARSNVRAPNCCYYIALGQQFSDGTTVGLGQHFNSVRNVGWTYHYVPAATTYVYSQPIGEQHEIIHWMNEACKLSDWRAEETEHIDCNAFSFISISMKIAVTLSKMSSDLKRLTKVSLFVFHMEETFDMCDKRNKSDCTRCAANRRQSLSPDIRCLNRKASIADGLPEHILNKAVTHFSL